uniref:Terminase n=1 Tax=viral metagenome TaxID=1070528 RepID=A0A6M3JLU8_9ZZZZ
MTNTQKEAAIEAIQEHGTLKSGAAAAGIDVKTLRAERKRSKIFDNRINDALNEGRERMGDESIQFIKDVRDGVYEKTDRNRLTAAIALANWIVTGFRGTTQVQGKIDHDVRVLTAVPRPKYIEEKKPKLIEDVIEGEIIKEE